MFRSTRLALGGVLVLALTFAVMALAAPPRHAASPSSSPPMMGGMLAGNVSSTANQSSPSTLAAVRGKVESWLHARGFARLRVSEVMAFSNNNYVAIEDARGRPAFELLTARGLNWLMEEPPSMMWNTRYGMMRGYGGSWSGMGSMMGCGMMAGSCKGWYGAGQGKVTSFSEAARVAARWLAESRPSEQVDPDAAGMGRFPGYYTLDTTRRGKTAGMLSVNASTGAVWYHGWHGRFIAEREF